MQTRVNPKIHIFYICWAFKKKKEKNLKRLIHFGTKQFVSAQTGRKDAWSSDNRLEMGHLHHNSATLYMQFNKWKKYACLLSGNISLLTW